MLDALKEMVRNVVLIVLLANFMELLLPNSSMQRYLRVVMGLFVLIAILNPVIALISQDEDFTVSAWHLREQGDTQLNSILSQGKEMQEKSQEVAVAEYQKRIAKQMQSLAQLVKGVDKVEVDLDVVQNTSSNKFGNIEKVALRVFPGTDGTEQQQPSEGTGTIDPVKIEINPQPDENKKTESAFSALSTQNAEIERAIKETIANFYGISPDKIQISFE